MSKQSVADSHFWLCRRRLRPVISKGTRQRLSLFNSSLSFTTTVFTTQYFKPVSLPCVHYPEYYCVHCLKLKYKPLTVTWNCCRKCPLLSRLGLAFETVLTSHQVTSHIHDNDEWLEYQAEKPGWNNKPECLSSLDLWSAVKHRHWVLVKLHKHVSHHVIDSELIPLVVVIGSLSLMFPVTNVLCNYVWRKSAEFLTCFFVLWHWPCSPKTNNTCHNFVN